MRQCERCNEHKQLIDFQSGRLGTMRSMMLKKTNSNRRGVTLLFVLTLIVLFLLMGASFVLIANQFRRSAVVLGRIKVRRDDARTLVNRAFYDVFRGPRLDDPRSPLRGHSILEDMYGYGWKQSNIPGTELIFVDPIAGGSQGGMYRITNLVPGALQEILDTTPSSYLTAKTNLNLAGLVISIVSATNTVTGNSVTFPPVSGRIVQFDRATNDATIIFDYDVSGILSDIVGNNQRVFEIVVNNRPFAGTGAGIFNRNAAINTNALSIDALRPNQTRDFTIPSTPPKMRDQFIRDYLWGSFDNATEPNRLSTNEDYDAADYQNMFLALVETERNNPNPTRVIPSFDRPTLRAYSTANDPPPAPAGNQPSRADFRAFGNSVGTVVDNDGDGFNDSVWIDIGLPIQTDVKGRVYKPLVSYMCVDMDGKINLNAHGNLAQLDPNFYKTPLPLLNGVPSTSVGQGYGPPEIDLRQVFPFAETSNLIFSRYGIDGPPPLVNVPGRQARDPKSAFKLSGYPNNSFALGGLTGNLFFGGPMDVHGRLGFGLANTFNPSVTSDPYDPMSASFANIPVGMPTADILNSTLPTPNEILNSAYELDFWNSPFENSFVYASVGDGSLSAVDNPYTSRELAAVLQRNNSGAESNAQRLNTLLSGSIAAADGRIVPHLITTESNEVPVPPHNLAEKLLRIQPTLTDAQIRVLLPNEVIRGLRFRVNRPFGNGLDDDGNGIVDEMSEVISDLITQMDGANVPFDANNDRLQDSMDALGRYQYAKHLYVLTLLVTQFDNTGAQITFDYNGDTVTDPNDVLAFRRDVAQWAINVVDFRDPDSIMTPFEFDLEPFDATGWDADGDFGPSATPPSPQPNQEVIWGCERPELLLTESLILHDRRTEDLATDDGDNNVMPQPPGDDDTDSRFVPNASTFFEIYNPWVHTTNPTVDQNNR
jgi:hypothetical protein